MPTYLITGISGFVAGHYLEYLFKHRPNAKVIGVDVNAPALHFLDPKTRKKIKLHEFSLLNTPKLEALIKKTKPDYILHLASMSSVGASWAAPVNCFVNNTNIFLNIVETIRNFDMKARVLSIGSSEEYGIVRKEDLPLKEEVKLNPVSPYAVARVSEEMISRFYAKGYGVPVICTRSFNHIGPRQREIFVVSGFAKQIIEAKRGEREKLLCGDLSIVRDFVDVRDVVRAYDLLLHKGEPGEVYNICSGKGYPLSEILDILQKKAGTDVVIEKDPKLIRPVDNPVIIGSCEKLKKAFSFAPKYSIQDMLGSMLNYWEKALSK